MQTLKCKPIIIIRSTILPFFNLSNDDSGVFGPDIDSMRRLVLGSNCSVYAENSKRVDHTDMIRSGVVGNDKQGLTIGLSNNVELHGTSDCREQMGLVIMAR